MESRWYIPPGKTLQTTKIKDRKHELHVCKDKWDKITSHLDRNRLIQEALDAEEQKKQAMKDTAEAMTKDWSDCLKNLKEKELPDSDAKNAKNLELYKTLRKEQEIERQMYVEEMKKKISKHTDFPKALSSALLLSSVVYERGKQIELDKKLKAHEQEEEAKFAAKVKAGAGDEERENREKEMKRMEANKAYAKELKETFEKREREKNEEYTKRIEQEKKELEYAKKEEILLKEYEHKQMLRKRDEKIKDQKEQMIQNQEYKNMKRKEEEQLDSFCKIIQNYKERIKQLTQKQEMEDKNARMKRAEGNVKQLEGYQSTLDEEENQRIQKVLAEKEAQYQEKMRADMEKRRKYKEMMIGARNEYIENIRREEAENTELKKLPMLNNCKNAEVNKKFEDNLRQAELDKAMKTKKIWDSDMEYKNSVKKMEEEEEKKELQQNKDTLQKDDDFFYEYAKEVTDFAKSRGWITYPIESVVNKHKTHILKDPPKAKPCVHMTKNNLINKTPGKMAHNPNSDPNYAKTKCKCCCHKDKLYK